MMRMRMRIRWKKHCEPMMDEGRMWRTQGLVGYIDRYECDDEDADDEQLASEAND